MTIVSNISIIIELKAMPNLLAIAAVRTLDYQTLVGMNNFTLHCSRTVSK